MSVEVNHGDSPEEIVKKHIDHTVDTVIVPLRLEFKDLRDRLSALEAANAKSKKTKASE